MNVRNNFSTFALLGTLIFIAGCGGLKVPDDLPKLHPAQIEITSDEGKKLEGAIVSLFLVGGGGEAVGAATDNKGIATLYTRDLFVGAPAGKYKVCVNWSIGVEMTPPPEGTPQRERYDEALKRPGYEPRITQYPALEPEFQDAKNTPLEVEIVEGKNNFSLTVKLSEMGKQLAAEHGK